MDWYWYFPFYPIAKAISDRTEFKFRNWMANAFTAIATVMGQTSTNVAVEAAFSFVTTMDCSFA